MHLAIVLGATLCGISLALNGFSFTDDNSASMDGCRYVYMDVGSNIGMHVRFLFEAENYPDNTYSKTIFDRFFMVNRNRADICAFGFEPNPTHVHRLDHLSALLESKGHSANFFHGGVSNETTTKTFYALPHDNHNDWGFSVLPRTGFTKQFTVHTLNLSEFILNKIAKRKIPPPLFLDDPPPMVIMKMDIEGSEYVVLPMMLATKALCEVDLLTIEYHDHHTDKIPKGSKARMQESLKEARDAGCKIRVLDFNDETYVYDTVEGRAEVQAMNK
jgi:hypothetical protein